MANDWLTVTPQSGQGNAVLTNTATEHKGRNQRSSVVTAVAEEVGVAKAYKVGQEASNEFVAVDQAVYSVGELQTTITITGKSNSPKLTFGIASGGQIPFGLPGVFTVNSYQVANGTNIPGDPGAENEYTWRAVVTVPRNRGYARSGQITITGSNANYQAVVTVNQAISTRTVTIALSLVERVTTNYGSGMQVSVPYGGSITMTAIPKQNTVQYTYGFDGWYDTNTQIRFSTDLTVTVNNITEDKSFTARGTQTLNNYTIALIADPAAGGTVAGGGVFPYNTTTSRQISATANPGYTFVKWVEVINGVEVDYSTSNTASVWVDGDHTYKAYFALIPYQVTIGAAYYDGNADPITLADCTMGNTGGVPTGSPSDVYFYGDTISVTASPNTGYEFYKWVDENGAVLATSASYSFAVTGAATVYAIFRKRYTRMTFKVVDGASSSSLNLSAGSITRNPLGTEDSSGRALYPYGTQVTFTANPATGYEFVQWRKDWATILSGNPLVLTINDADAGQWLADVTLYAQFQKRQFTINYTAGTGIASVSRASETVEYGGNALGCTATAAQGYGNITWYDDNDNVVGTGATFAPTNVTEGATYRAVAVLNNYTVSTHNWYRDTDPNDGGNWSVSASETSSPGGTITGRGTYAYGSTVTLIAAPNAGYEFIGWYDGVGTFLSNDLIFTLTNSLDSDRTIIGQFQKKWFTVNFEQGAGANVVESTVRVPYGQNAVSNKATPAAGYNSVWWDITSGGGVPIFPDGMKSAGTAYDEMTATKAIKRIGVVDLGTLNWTYNGGVFYTTLSSLGKKYDNLRCIPYSTNGAISYTNMPDKSIGSTSGGATTLYIKNSAYSDAATFKAAMNGVLLYYELATPEEYDLAKNLSIGEITVPATQKRLPEDTEADVSAPMRADFVYQDQGSEAELDAKFTYRVQPQVEVGDGNSTVLVSLSKIKGFTLVWNQLMRNVSGSATANGVTIEFSNGHLKITGTATALATTIVAANFALVSDITKRVGHKVAIIAKGSMPSLSYPRIYLGSGVYLFSGLNQIATIPSGTFSVCSLAFRYASGTTYNHEIDLLFVDFTQEFGAGNEPATVEEFEALYYKKYYANNAGKLINNIASAIQFVGKNQFNIVGRTEDTSTFTHGQPHTFDETKYIKGMAATDYYNSAKITNLSLTNNSVSFTAADSVYGVGFPMKCLPNTLYNIQKTGGGSSVANTRVAFFDIDGVYINNTFSQSFTTPANCYWVVLIFTTAAANASVTYSDICISIYDTRDHNTNGVYEPYEVKELGLHITSLTSSGAAIEEDDGVATVYGVRSDLTVTAIADAVGTFTVDYTKNSYVNTISKQTEQVSYGGTATCEATLPADTSQYTYAFDGWYENGARISTSLVLTVTNITGNRAFEARATRTTRQYTLSGVPAYRNTDGTGPYTDGTTGGTCNSYTTSYGSGASIVATPATGYQFDGWFDADGNLLSSSTTYALASLTADTVVYPKFTKQYFTITYVGGNYTNVSTASERVAYGANAVGCTAIPASNTAHYSFTFKGWYVSGSESRPVSTSTTYAPQNVTADASYVAVSTRTVNHYTVTYVAGDYIANISRQSESVAYGSNGAGCTATVNSNTAQYAYAFDGWYNGATKVSSNLNYVPTNVTGNITLTAKGTRSVRSYAIAASVDPAARGSVSGAGNYQYGSTAQVACTLNNAGDVFGGWFEGGTLVSSQPTYSFTVNGARTLVAKIYYLDVSTNSVDICEEGGSQTFTITTNTSWTISSS